MKSVLVTGATGFIGSNLVNSLVAKPNVKVYALVRDLSAVLPAAVQKVFYDGSFESLAKQLTDVKIDGVFHLATHFCSQHKSEEIHKLLEANLILGCHLLEWMSKNACDEFINIGTYAQSMDGRHYQPQNLYAATKTAYEKLLDFYVGAFQLKCVTLYLHDSYGPGDRRPKLINLILNALHLKQPLNMSPGFQEICYVHIRDVVAAIEVASSLVSKQSAGSHERFSVFTSEVQNLRQLVDIICEVTGQQLDPQYGFYPYRAREIMHFAPRYKQLAGWRPQVALRTGIQEIWQGMGHADSKN